MTNEEVIKDMTTEELGDFLCGISGRCSVCELKEHCGYKYFSGWADWLETEYSGNIYNDFYMNSFMPKCGESFGWDTLDTDTLISILDTMTRIISFFHKVKDRIQRKEKINVDCETANRILKNTMKKYGLETKRVHQIIDELYKIEGDKKEMDSRVTKFLTDVMNGKETNVAIEESGVRELTTDEVLTEIAGVWNKNTLETLVKFSEWANTSDALIKALQTLKKSSEDVKGLDVAIETMREFKQ